MKWSELLSKRALSKGLALATHAICEQEKDELIYPPADCIFKALELTPPEEVKCIIVGQDPYHTPGAANGLAFSINPGRKIQPSLLNIFKELQSDLGYPIPENGDLTPWAKHGVLLLNTSLTVYDGHANSCASWGWDEFTGEVLSAAHRLPQPIVYILWGLYAQDLGRELMDSPVVTDTPGVYKENIRKKAYIMSSHPSPLSAARKCAGSQAFRGSKPFSTANNILTSWGGTPVDWRLL